MTLILLLIALGLDFFVDGLERSRAISWWIGYHYWTEKKLGHVGIWSGPLGVICLLLLPMVIVIGLQLYLDHYSWFLESLFTLALLIYCLSPEKLDRDLDYYISAIEEENDAERERLEAELVSPEFATDGISEVDVIKSSLLESQQRSFAIIFWFLVLGIAGAVLYRLVSLLSSELREIRGGFADSLRDLLNILEWPSSRLAVLGMALAGHLMQALDGWRRTEKLSLGVNREVLTEGGLGALQYDAEVDVSSRGKAYWMRELKGQLNRTLIIWLAVIAIMTLSGKLG